MSTGSLRASVSWRARYDKLTDVLLLTLGWTVAAVIVRPFQNTPFIDDWVYAWPVQWLLESGQLRLLDYSGSLNPAQVLWGALFCWPLGFSFTALRISTWVLGLTCLVGLYLLLREFEVPRPAALIGTVTLAVYPVFFILAGNAGRSTPHLAGNRYCGYGAQRGSRFG